MAENKNKKNKNVTSMDKLTVSLQSSQLNSKGSGASNSSTAYTLSLDNKKGNLVLKIQTESSKKSDDSNRQNKSTSSRTKNTPHASKTHSNVNTGQKSSPNTSKTHANSNTGQKNYPNPSKPHTNWKTDQNKSSHAPKPHFNTEQKNPPHHTNTGHKNSGHAFTHTNFKSEPKSSQHAFKTYQHTTQGQKNSQAVNVYPNWTEQKDAPPAFKIQPTMNNYSLSNSQVQVNNYFFGDQMKDSMLQGAAERGGPTGPSQVPNIAANSTFSTQPTASSKPNRARSASRPRHNTRDNELNCPTCKRTFSSIIYQCPSGHSSCRVCKEDYLPCGTCGQTITAMRNFALEEYFAMKTAPCPHNIDGCKLVIKMSEIDIHVNKCPFGMIKCPSGCAIKMSLNQLSTHFDDKHPEQRLPGVGSEIELRYIYELNNNIYLVQLGPYHFLFHEWVWPEDSCIYMAAQLIGTKAGASKWTYEIHIYNKNEPHRKYTFSEICTSFAEPVFDIFKEGKCCILTRKHAVSFLNGPVVNYKFFIKKISEENP